MSNSRLYSTKKENKDNDEFVVFKADLSDTEIATALSTSIRILNGVVKEYNMCCNIQKDADRLNCLIYIPLNEEAELLKIVIKKFKSDRKLMILGSNRIQSQMNNLTEKFSQDFKISKFEKSEF